MKNVLVVSNYNAGRKRALFHKKLLVKFLLKHSENFKFVTIDEFNYVDLGEYDTIFAMGGDGTVNKVASALVDTDKILGIIPCGTANLLAAKLGLSMNLKRTLKIIEQENIKKIDTIDVNGHFCVLRTGFGYDSDIICKTPQSLKNKFGYFAYFIAGIIFALRLVSKSYEINYDDNQIKTDATCIIIANSTNMYQNFISIGNNSELDDGYFDIFILNTQNPIIFFYEFLRIIIGIKKDNSRAKYFQAKSLKIKNNWINCHIDGEKTKLKEDIEIKMRPKNLKIFSK